MKSTKLIKVVHFGDKLQKHRKMKSVIETMEPYFSEIVSIKTYSDEEKPLFRAIDFLVGFFNKGIFADYIIIDVYSTFNFYYAFFISLLCVVFKKKYILFLHGGNLPYRYKKSEFIFNYILKKSNNIVSPSGYLKYEFENVGFQVELIPNIIEKNKYIFKERNFESPNILYLRGFGQIYNPMCLVKAIILLKVDYPNINVHMLGSDPNRRKEDIQSFINNNDLSNNIFLYEGMQFEDWHKISEKSNLMVSCPLIDNMPISILEGMALGLLIISSEVGGIPYLVTNKKTGLLFRSDDEKELAECIKLSITDSEKSKEITNSGREYISNFYWENVRLKWLEVFTLNK